MKKNLCKPGKAKLKLGEIYPNQEEGSNKLATCYFIVISEKGVKPIFWSPRKHSPLMKEFVATFSPNTQIKESSKEELVVLLKRFKEKEFLVEIGEARNPGYMNITSFVGITQ